MLRIRSRLGFSGVSRPAWILLAGNALDAVGLGIFFPILPLFVEHRGGTPLLVGVIGASALVGNVLAQAPGGWLADRYDRRLIVVASIAAYGAFFLVYLIPIPVQVLPFVRFLHAGVGGFYMPAARALLADYTPPDRRGMIFGHWQASSMGGFLIGPTIGGLLALVRLDLVFVSSAIAGGLGALLLSTLPPGLARDEAGRYEGPTGLPKVERHLLWLLLPAILAGAAYQYLGGVYGATWVLYVTALGGSPLIAGLSLSLYSLPLVLFSAAAGPWPRAPSSAATARRLSRPPSRRAELPRHRPRWRRSPGRDLDTPRRGGHARLFRGRDQGRFERPGPGAGPRHRRPGADRQCLPPSPPAGRRIAGSAGRPPRVPWLARRSRDRQRRVPGLQLSPWSGG